MADQEDELKSLRDKNTELVQKVQYWKMTAAQRENEKLELMKEINELRLKVIRLKSGGAAEARKLDAALQSASEQALSHLVQASSAVARTIELAKTYMRDREGNDIVSPRWSSISNTNEKVHRVPPMMIGGQSIQPVVSLSRATFNLNGSRQLSRSPNSNRNVTVRALPMHMLQDVYIPLTRIDMRPAASNNENEQEPAANDSADNIPFDTSMEETPEEPENMTTDDDYDSSRRLDVVTEDLEPENEEGTPPRASVENPLEGPSWLLDVRGSTGDLEPDSTTEEPQSPTQQPDHTPEGVSAGGMFTPTVRRRKRAASPPPPPPLPPPPPPPPPPRTPHADPNTLDGLESSRVLQVLVPKMRLGSNPSPAKRRFDAPSPNGATDYRVIVSEELETDRERRSIQPNETNTNTRRDNGDSNGNTQTNSPPHVHDNCSRGENGDCNGNSQGHVGDNYSRRDNGGSHGNSQHVDDNCRSRRESGDSDSGSGVDRVSEGRTRRKRKPVTYKEKPLNRKLRR